MRTHTDGSDGLASALLVEGITRAYPGGVIACRGGHPLIEPWSAYLPAKVPAKKKEKKKKEKEKKQKNKQKKEREREEKKLQTWL